MNKLLVPTILGVLFLLTPVLQRTDQNRKLQKGDENI